MELSLVSQQSPQFNRTSRSCDVGKARSIHYRRILMGACVVLSALLCPLKEARADAQVLLPFQGILRTSTGAVITSATNVTFSLFTQEAGGTALWTEAITLTPDNGVVSATLGEVEAIAPELVANLDLYLAVRVAGEAEMVPRIRLGASPNAAFAFRALQADTANQASHAETANTANSATTAASATTATTAESANAANFATSAGNADAVDGRSAEEFADVNHQHALVQLEDVSITSPQNGQVLTFEFGSWVARTPTGGGGGEDGDWLIQGDDLIAIPSGSVAIGTDAPEAKLHVVGDVKAAHVLADGFESLAGDGTAPFLVASSTLVDGLNADLLDGFDADDLATVDHEHELVGLSDVGVGDLIAGQVLVYDGAVWTNDDVPSELGEIAVTNPTGGNVLLYDGASWINGYVSSDELEDQVRFGSGATSGRVEIFAVEEGRNVVELSRETAGSGSVEIFNNAGQSIIRAHADAQGDDGALVVEGFQQVKDTVTRDVKIQSATLENAGVFSVLNNTGTTVAGIDGRTGNIFGTTKSFLVPDPTDESRLIKYTSIEGPEAGIYARGHAELVGGRATIALPEHFSVLVDPESITVSLTPRSASSLGLAAIVVTGTEITIAELQNGTGAYSFDYLVQGTRQGFENYEVYVPLSTRDAFAPREGDFSDR